jgi:hypothetical protein
MAAFVEVRRSPNRQQVGGKAKVCFGENLMRGMRRNASPLVIARELLESRIVICLEFLEEL